MKTNLTKIKEMAYMYLHVDYMETKVSFIISHPFTNNAVCMLLNGDLIDAKAPGNWELFLKDREKAIRQASLIKLLAIMNKVYMLSFFWRISTYVSEEDFASILREAWQFSESPNRDADVSNKEAIKLFKKAKPNLLMNEEEYKKIQELPEYIEVYRGVSDFNKDNKTALSWTLDKDQAVWFAKRYNQKGELWTLKIHKKDILAFFNGEDEIIIDSMKYINDIVIEKL